MGSCQGDPKGFLAGDSRVGHAERGSNGAELKPMRSGEEPFKLRGLPKVCDREIGEDGTATVVHHDQSEGRNRGTQSIRCSLQTNNVFGQLTSFDLKKSS